MTPHDELPGMWETADFMGGATDSGLTPGDELRAAAVKLREMAATAKSPLWWPELANPLEKWLERQAATLDAHLPHWGSHPGGIDTPPIIRTPEDTAALVEYHFADSLAVARAVLGEKP